MAELRVSTPDGRDETVRLTDDPVTFGRADDCDVVLSEQMASRRHCSFKPRRGGWRVVDEGSSNGTWLGGKPVLSARLQPGDEIEIGETIISFESAQPGDAPKIRKRPSPAAPWGLLLLPVAFGFAAWLGTGAHAAAARSSADDAWALYARAVVDRADLSTEEPGRDRILRGLLDRLPAEPAAGEARLHAKAALAASGPDPDGSGGSSGRADSSGWRQRVAELDEGWAPLSPAARRSRIVELLDRHADEPAAAQALRKLLERLQGETGGYQDADRRRTEQESARAAAEGRFSDALALWNGWLLRAPPLERDDERAVSKHLAAISAGAMRASERDLERVNELASEGREDAAVELLDGALAKLRGTGYDAWLVARTVHFRAPTEVPGVPTVARKGASSSTRERTLALRALAGAEDLAHLRRFADGADRLQAMLGELSDADLRGELEERMGQLRQEATFLAALSARIRSEPRRFGPLKLEDGTWRVNGATDDALLLGKKDELETRGIESLPTSALAQLCRQAPLEAGELVPAALVMWDAGENDAYVHFMRQALSVEADDERLAVSAVHARQNGRPLPDAGYVPHPDADGGIITWDELNAIRNAEKIVAYTGDLTKLVEKLETSKQAKSIAKVAKAYAALEAAREHALELIFDEEKYFYPYRDRMKEYVPVSREVDERVDAVRDAWAAKATGHPKRDRNLDKLLDDADDLRIEIDYLGGDASKLWSRVAAVTRYLDRKLTVRNFYRTDQDLRLIERNDEVMDANAAMETIATDDEREQVKITNEYRIMFGHRRAVRVHDQLVEAARGHSEDMARLGFFAHFSPVPGKRSPSDRVTLAGYPLMGCSENIHAGSGSPRGAHNSWIHSSGHHRNILMPSWVEMGTGRSGRYWTQNFGFRDLDEDW
jgi:uncharacterized protein YkwD